MNNFICEICGLNFETYRGFAVHIGRYHKNEITPEEYYLQYISKKGKCLECGKDTMFRNLSYGYNKFCSQKCLGKNNEIQNKKKKTNIKNSGYENPMCNPKNKEKSKETTLRNNNGIDPRKLTYQKLKERYPLLVKVENLKEGPNGEILAHCKNSNCKNSKENGGWFEPTIYQLNWRKQGIDKNDIFYFYCCEECKNTCPLYKKSSKALSNLINEDSQSLYTQEEYSTWKKEVYHRQRVHNNIDYNFCEYCNSTENLHVHHEVPQKIEPGFILDPENGIIFCEKCHYEKGHKKGTKCSTGNLASKICK